MYVRFFVTFGGEPRRLKEFNVVFCLELFFSVDFNSSCVSD